MLKNYIVLVQEDDNELGRWYFECEAENADHAEEQAIDHGDYIRSIAVFEQVRP